MLFLAASLIVLVLIYQNNFTRMKQREAEQLLKASLESERKERERIAADLHDGVSADLAAMRNLLYIAEKSGAVTKDTLLDIRSGVENALENTRQASYRLMPPLLEKSGLDAALREYFENLSQKSGLTFRWNGTGVIGLDTVKSYEVFRIIQEVTTNMIKHGKLSACDGNSVTDDRVTLVSLIDDGIPFDFESGRAHSSGAGMKNISMRLKAVGAEMEVRREGNQNHYLLKISAT